MSEVSVDYGAYGEAHETRSAFSGVSSSYTQGTFSLKVVELSLPNPEVHGSNPINKIEHVL